MDYSKLTLGELLSSRNETIKRNAVSILKVLQKAYKCYDEECGYSVPHLHELGENIITDTGLSKREMRKV